MSAEHLLDLWLEMLAAAGDSKQFQNAQSHFTDQYKKNKKHQGEFHHLLAENHRQWVKEHQS
jgi:hypothetical protein